MVNTHRMRGDDFEVVKVIGRGAFGEVQLVRIREAHTHTKMQKFISLTVRVCAVSYTHLTLPTSSYV